MRPEANSRAALCRFHQPSGELSPAFSGHAPNFRRPSLWAHLLNNRIRVSTLLYPQLTTLLYKCLHEFGSQILVQITAPSKHDSLATQYTIDCYIPLESCDPPGAACYWLHCPASKPSGEREGGKEGGRKEGKKKRPRIVLHVTSSGKLNIQVLKHHSY